VTCAREHHARCNWIDDPEARCQELGPDWHDRHVNRTRKTRWHVRELEHLGYSVTLATAV